MFFAFVWALRLMYDVQWGICILPEVRSQLTSIFDSTKITRLNCYPVSKTWKNLFLTAWQLPDECLTTVWWLTNDSHCSLSSNSFHGQITQKAVHQLSDQENKKCSPWKVFGTNHPQTLRLFELFARKTNLKKKSSVPRIFRPSYGPESSGEARVFVLNFQYVIFPSRSP